LAPVHLVKLAVVAGVWQVSQAAVVTIVRGRLASLRCDVGAAVAIGAGGGGDHRVVHNRPAPLGVVRGGRRRVAGVARGGPIVMWLVDKPALGRRRRAAVAARTGGATEIVVVYLGTGPFGEAAVFAAV